MSLAHPPESYSSMLKKLTDSMDDPQRAYDHLPTVARQLLRDANIPLNRTVDPLPHAHPTDQAPFKTPTYVKLIEDKWEEARPPAKPQEVKHRGQHQARLLGAHKAASKKWEAGKERQWTGYWVQEKHSSKTPVDKLESVCLDTMHVGPANVGKFLIVRTLAVPFMRIGVTTVVEDFMGRAVDIELYNLPIGDLDADDLAVLYPIGTYLCIREPTWVERMTDASNYIAVHSPTDLIRLHPDDDLLINYGWPDPDNAPKPLPPTFDFKASGNTYFKQQKYILAAARYTEGLSHATSCSSTLQETGLLVLNRAAAHLESQNWNQARMDCRSAIKIGRQYYGTKESVERSKFEAKAWYRMGRASEGVKNDTDAVGNYERALRIAGAHPDAVTAIARCRARIVERGRGEYNWTTLFQAGVNLETRPSLSAGDFTGPINVKVGLKKERHVVANRTIDPGELLLVEKPVAVGWPDNRERKRTLTRVDLNRHVANGTPMLDLVSSLVKRCIDSPKLMIFLEALYAGPKYPRSENQATDPAIRSGAYSRDINVEKLELICHYNAFTLSPLTNLSYPRAPVAPLTLESPTALYLQASAFNHSCTPNAILHTIGDVLIVRARDMINSGDQITIAYQDGGLSKCQLHLGHFAGRCTCPLCTRDSEADPATIVKRDKTLCSPKYASLGVMDWPNRKLLKIITHHKQVQTITQTLESTYLRQHDPRRPGLRKPYLEIAYILLAVDPVLYFDVAEHFILEAGRASGLEFEEYVNDEGIPDVHVLAAPYDIPSVESFVESIMWLTMVATRLSSELPRRVLVWSTLLTVVHTAAYGGPDRPGADSSLYQRRTEKYYPALAQIPI